MQNHTDRGAVLKSSFFKGNTAFNRKSKRKHRRNPPRLFAVKSEEGWYMSEYVMYCHESGVLSGKILRRKCFL